MIPDESLFLKFDSEREITASCDIPIGKLLCTFNYSPISKEMFDTARVDEYHVLRKSVHFLPKGAEPKYILCTKEDSQIDLGNYAKVGDSINDINAELVWGESQDFQRAIFIQTTKEISKGDKIILSNPIESKNINITGILKYDNLFEGYFNDGHRDLKIRFMKEVWPKLFLDNKDRYENVFRLNPNQTVNSFCEFMALLKDYMLEKYNLEDVKNEIKRTMMFDLYVDEMSRNHKSTPGSGLCHTVSAYQIHSDKINFLHSKNNQELKDYMNDIKEGINKYSAYFDQDKFKAVRDNIEENIALIDAGQRNKYTWGDIDILMYSIRNIYNKDIANSKAITLSSQMPEALGELGDLVGDPNLKNLLNGEYRVLHDSRFGYLFKGLTLDEFSVLVTDTNFISFDGKHYWINPNCRDIKKFNSKNLLRIAFDKFMERFVETSEYLKSILQKKK